MIALLEHLSLYLLVCATNLANTHVVFCGHLDLAGVDPELSTILTGDWLALWPIVNSNKHTQAWEAYKRAQRQRQQQ